MQNMPASFALHLFLKKLEDAKDESTLKIIKLSRVSLLREVKDDRTDIFICVLSINPSCHGELMDPDGVDWQNKKKREAENNSLEAGDPRIIWGFSGKVWSAYWYWP